MSQDARGAELRQLKRELLAADDQQVRRLVALVDRVAVRGEADTLIAPLRPRLAVLRPPRPLAFVRLLFLPVDPLIMPPSRWRPGAVGIPRAALRALAGTVSAGMGDAAEAIAAGIAGHTTDELNVVCEAGSRLWPSAAAVLRDAGVPPGWTEASGLHGSEFGPLAAALAALLREGPALWLLADPRADPPTPSACEYLLAGAAEAGAQPLAMMLALLLARLPQAGGLLQYADDLAARATDAGRVAPDRALDYLLSGIEDRPQGNTPDQVDEFRRAALLLETLVLQSQRRPSRANRLERARRHLDDTCREAFRTSAAAMLPPGKLPAGATAGLETTARLLRRMDAVGRRLGGATFYDTTLSQTAERLAQTEGLARTDRLRLAEILLGPDAALALYGPV